MNIPPATTRISFLDPNSLVGEGKIQSIGGRNRRTPEDPLSTSKLKLCPLSSTRCFRLSSATTDGVFYSSWKVARLVLIPKAKAAPVTPSLLHPLCMLDTTLKVV
ncbi:hypothetical protein J6590_059410 [Homalodisca vitripennis]|nr:hypothetical protein J6590_059410 [Homalodisca vitripennis]